MPSFGPKLVLGSELAESLLFSSQRVRPEALEGSGYTFAQPDLEGALRDAARRAGRGLMDCGPAAVSGTRLMPMTRVQPEPAARNA